LRVDDYVIEVVQTTDNAIKTVRIRNTEPEVKQEH
jgi:Mg2+/Co2+ transporter CorB